MNFRLPLPILACFIVLLFDPNGVHGQNNPVKFKRLFVYPHGLSVDLESGVFAIAGVPFPEPIERFKGVDSNNNAPASVDDIAIVAFDPAFNFAYAEAAKIGFNAHINMAINNKKTETFVSARHEDSGEPSLFAGVSTPPAEIGWMWSGARMAVEADSVFMFQVLGEQPGQELIVEPTMVFNFQVRDLSNIKQGYLYQQVGNSYIRADFIDGVWHVTGEIEHQDFGGVDEETEVLNYYDDSRTLVVVAIPSIRLTHNDIISVVKTTLFAVETFAGNGISGPIVDEENPKIINGVELEGVTENIPGGG